MVNMAADVGLFVLLVAVSAFFLFVAAWVCQGLYTHITDTPRYELVNRRELRRLKRNIASARRRNHAGDLEDAEAALRNWTPRTRNRVQW